jgi:hypothetical protein
VLHVDVDQFTEINVAVEATGRASALCAHAPAGLS